MTTFTVDSTILRTIGYDAERQLLQIEFQDLSTYQYFDVPAAVYEELAQAPSKGTFFNRSIRPKFDYALAKAGFLS